jgi:RNA polymerase sigma-70 factor (ECF subfamily)
MEPEEERRLILAAAVDNDDAFRRLYDHYLPRVYAYVGYRIDTTADVEDVVAEVFMAMSRGLRRFTWRGPGSFSAWLFRIAHNEVARHYRRRGARDREQSLDAAPETPDYQAAAGAVVEASEQAALIRQLLDALPPRQQEVILLKYFGDLRNRDIAQLLNLDERTVAAHLSRGLEALRRLWPAAANAEERERR